MKDYGDMDTHGSSELRAVSCQHATAGSLGQCHGQSGLCRLHGTRLQGPRVLWSWAGRVLKVEDRRELDGTIMPEEDGMRGSPWSPMSYGQTPAHSLLPLPSSAQHCLLSGTNGQSPNSAFSAWSSHPWLRLHGRFPPRMAALGEEAGAAQNAWHR